MHPEHKEIIELKKAFPNEKVLHILERYKKEYGFADYYGALDSMVYKLGISWGHQPIDDAKTNKQIGYIPVIIYSQENALNEMPGKHNLAADISPYKKLDDSKRFATKEVIYKLMHIKNIEHLIFPKTH